MDESQLGKAIQQKKLEREAMAILDPEREYAEFFGRNLNREEYEFLEKGRSAFEELEKQAKTPEELRSRVVVLAEEAKNHGLPLEPHVYVSYILTETLGKKLFSDS